MAETPTGLPRQSKISPARLEKFLKAVSDGQYKEVAAQLAGINSWTSSRWLRRGEDEIARVGQIIDEPEVAISDWLDDFVFEKSPTELFKADHIVWVATPPEHFEHTEWLFVLFVQLYEMARAWAESTAIKNIRRAATAGNWQADAWYLERTRGDRYGRRQVVEHGGVEGGVPIQQELTVSSSVDGLLAKVVELAEQETR